MDLQKRGRKTEYIHFMKAATGDKSSKEHKQMNQFLVRCFMDADVDFDGKVSWHEFNFMVDRAISTPRYFGIIESSAEKYSSEENMEVCRRDMFAQIDKDNHGFIRLHDWLHFYFEYFGTMLQNFEESVARSKMHASRKDFAMFICKAARSRSSFEYKELYRFLTYCFLAADEDQSGCVSGEEFDVMIDLATKAPRKFGFAPPTSVFKDEEQRLKSRNHLLQTVIDGTSEEDRVSLDQWIDYCYRHICQKARMLDRRLTGVAPPPVREQVESKAAYGESRQSRAE